MKKLLIILAVLVMDLRADDSSHETRQCVYGRRILPQQKELIPVENIILIKLLG